MHADPRIAVRGFEMIIVTKEATNGQKEKKKMPTVSCRNGLPDARVAFEDRGFWRGARTTE